MKGCSHTFPLYGTRVAGHGCISFEATLRGSTVDIRSCTRQRYLEQSLKLERSVSTALLYADCWCQQQTDRLCHRVVCPFTAAMRGLHSVSTCKLIHCVRATKCIMLLIVTCATGDRSSACEIAAEPRAAYTYTHHAKYSLKIGMRSVGIVEPRIRIKRLLGRRMENLRGGC